MLDLILAMASAVTAPTAPDTYACITKATGEQGYQRCHAEQTAYLEAQLEISWRKLLDRVSHEGGRKAVTALQAEQRAWRAYQQKACQLFWQGSYGTDQRWLDGPACRAAVIETRISALEASYTALDPDSMGH